MAIPMSTAGMPSTVREKVSLDDTRDERETQRTDEQPLPPVKACHATHVRDTSSDETSESAAITRSVLEKNEEGRPCELRVRLWVVTGAIIADLEDKDSEGGR